MSRSVSILYLKRPDGKRLYRQPGYLICTDVDLPLETLLQEYIWRWDIEVNHRASTQDLVNELRRDLWSESINPKHLTDFMNRNPGDAKSVKSETDMCSAILASTA